MRKLFVFSVSALLVVFAAAQEKHPWLEKQDSTTRAMLEQYGATEEYLDMQDEMDRIVENGEEAARKERNTRLAIIAVSLLAAAWTFVVGIRTFRQAERKTRGGVIMAIGILILGCVVIFAFNYGIMIFRHNSPGAFNYLMAVGIVLALLVVAVLMLKKNPPKK